MIRAPLKGILFANAKNTHRTYPGHIFATAGLVVIHVNPLQLEVRVAHIAAGGVDAVLITEQ